MPNNKHKWNFTAKFRSNLYDWRSSQKAIRNLKAAVKEIKDVAKRDHEVAGLGIVKLAERIWPAFQAIDTSSGSLGSAVRWALEDELVPLMVSLEVGIDIRRNWMETLLNAIHEDGVDYLCPMRERWGDLSGFNELAGEWADRTKPEILSVYAEQRLTGEFNHTHLDTICFSCLLFVGRYDELKELLNLKPHRSWYAEKYQAMALVQQGRINEAIDYAESRPEHSGDFVDPDIARFCEQTLLDAGRGKEAYQRYGIRCLEGNTYLNQFRRIVRKYPMIERRKILEDLIQVSASPSVWFSASRQSGFLDLALKSALSGRVNPSTLISSSRDLIEDEPAFACQVAMRALEHIIAGDYYEVTLLEVVEAYGLAMRGAAVNHHEKILIQNLNKWIASAPRMDKMVRNQLQEMLSFSQSHQDPHPTKK
jgi:hypothetical protein